MREDVRDRREGWRWVRERRAEAYSATANDELGEAARA